MPKVTIAVPCYNHGAFLPETLRSVFAQTFQDFEVIIVNDGSTDRMTIELLNSLDLPKVRIITTENRGVSEARNRAFAEASGQYLLPLDADDMLEPAYLEKAVAVLEEQSEIAVVYTDQILFGDKSCLLVLPDYDNRRILAENLLHASAVFRREVWAEVGGYSVEMTRGWEDWDFWIAVSRRGWKVMKLNEPLFRYRVRGDSRDNRMLFSDKISMFRLMIKHHRVAYLENLCYVLYRFAVHLTSVIRFSR